MLINAPASAQPLHEPSWAALSWWTRRLAKVGRYCKSEQKMSSQGGGGDSKCHNRSIPQFRLVASLSLLLRKSLQVIHFYANSTGSRGSTMPVPWEALIPFGASSGF